MGVGDIVSVGAGIDVNVGVCVAVNVGGAGVWVNRTARETSVCGLRQPASSTANVHMAIHPRCGDFDTA